MEDIRNKGFATQQIHAGAKKDAYGSLTMPIYMTSTFAFDTVAQGSARFAGEEQGYVYTRAGNPTLTQVEEKIAVLEGAEAALGTASGMGAISSAIWTILEAGDEIVASNTLYGCTFALLSADLPRLGFKVHFVDFTDLDAVGNAINEKTKIVYFETPCNPTLKVVDIEAVCKLAHEKKSDVCVMVDNTFASPYLQQPLKLGADVVVHSATKYINGHGDEICGFIAGSADFILAVRTCGLKEMTGAVMDPHCAFMINRGLGTLDLRMEKHCANAMEVAQFLHDHPAVEKVYYPGLPDFEGYEIAKKQMRLPGAMLSIDLKGGREMVGNAVNKLKMCRIAVSLGDAETLVEHPATMTHATHSAQDLKDSGISEGLVRISVGREDAADIIEDLKQALDTLL